jgi:hypothetical protein
MYQYFSGTFLFARTVPLLVIISRTLFPTLDKQSPYLPSSITSNSFCELETPSKSISTLKSTSYPSYSLLKPMVSRYNSTLAVQATGEAHASPSKNRGLPRLRNFTLSTASSLSCSQLTITMVGATLHHFV